MSFSVPKMMSATMEYLEKRKVGRPMPRPLPRPPRRPHSACVSPQSKDESFTYEVIIVNDGSSDGTSEVIDVGGGGRQREGPQLIAPQEALKLVSQYGTATVRLLELEKNRGKGGAVRLVRCPQQLVSHHCCHAPCPAPLQGCLSARGERLLFADADGATSISDLGRLEERLDVLTTDYVSGAQLVSSVTCLLCALPSLPLPLFSTPTAPPSLPRPLCLPPLPHPHCPALSAPPSLPTLTATPSLPHPHSEGPSSGHRLSSTLAGRGGC